MRKRKAKTKNKRVSINQRQRSQRKKRQKRKYPTRKKLVVLLGAGFSFPAGLPLAEAIKIRFDRDQRRMLLRFGSSEWKWVDGKSDTEVHNGQIHSDHFGYSYILNELRLSYKKQVGAFEDYEDFFQYVIDTVSNNEEISVIYQNSLVQFERDFPNISDEYLSLFQTPSYTRIIDILNYLIADMLYSNINIEILSETYQPFLKFLNKYEKTEIFTLNHDLIVEGILEYNKIPYTKGFKTQGSEIAYEGKRLPSFNKRIANKRVYLFKLHGSITSYAFKHAKKVGSTYHLTDKHTYFTTVNYYEKHNAYRIDKTTGEIIQGLNIDIVPKFITGKKKNEIIKNDLMYSFLHNRFNYSIKTPSTIFISGYSYGDEHINKGLRKSKCKLVINQNPVTPYRFNQKHFNIKYLDELSTI